MFYLNVKYKSMLKYAQYTPIFEQFLNEWLDFLVFHLCQTLTIQKSTSRKHDEIEEIGKVFAIYE